MDQASLGSGDGGMDGGVALRSTSQALSTPSSCGNTAGLSNAPWPMRGGCPTHVKSAEIGPVSDLKRWSFDTLSDVRSSAVVASDGNILIGSDNGKVYKINPSSGVILQEVAIGGAIKSSPAIAADSTVLVTSRSGILRARHYSDLSFKWDFPSTGKIGAITGSPVILPDSSIVFGSDDRIVYQVDASGKEKWRYATGGIVESSPAVSPDGSLVYVGSNDTYLYALNVVTKKLQWRTKLAGAVTSSPAVARGRVFISAGSKAYALDAATGTILWQPSLGSGTVYSPAVSESGAVLFGVKFTFGGSMMALSPSDGTTLWRFDTLGGVETTAVIDKFGSSYFGDNAGSMNAVDAAGKVIFKHTLPNGPLAGIKSSAVISSTGGLIFGGDDNWIYSMGTTRTAIPNGGTCNSDADCEPGLLCGVGNGARFGKPAGTHACWIPSCENKVKDPLETEVDCGGPCGSCVNICSQACTLGSQVTPPALEVLSFSQGAFTRGSIGTYQTSANSLAVARGDQLRYEDRGDGNGRVALFEGPRTNRMVWSQEMGHTPDWWTGAVAQTPTMTLTEDATLSPSGTATADRWQAQAGGNAARAQTIINAMPAGSLSTWLRLTDPASFNPGSPLKTRTVLTDLTGGWYNEVLDWTLPAAWERRSMVTTPATKSTAVQMSHKGTWPGNATQFPALPAADFVVWGWQLEEGKFPSSYIPTQESALTRKVDRLVFAASDVPAWVRTGIWQVDVLPLYSSAEIATTDEFVLMAWEGGHISLGKDATGGIVKVVSGTQSATRSMQWSRNDKLTLSISKPASVVSLASSSGVGATLGIGSMAIGTGRVGVGALLDGTKPAFARLSEIRRVSPDLAFCTPDPDCASCGDGFVSSGEVCDPVNNPRCNASCTAITGPTACDSDDSCGPGLGCPDVPNGEAFGLDAWLRFCVSIDLCLDTSTPLCGNSSAPCGACACQPSCANKACGGDRSDGCGGVCEDLCADLSIGCVADSDCGAGFSCGIGMGPRYGKPAGTNVCWPLVCDDYDSRRLECGTTQSLCGLCPVILPRCDGRACSMDSAGGSCGSCPPRSVCTAFGACFPMDVDYDAINLDPNLVTSLATTPLAEVGALPGTASVTELGTASYSIPIEAPIGPGRLTPSLSLHYDSSSGDGPVGHGWSLRGLSAIRRCASTNAQNGSPSDVEMLQSDPLCLDGQQLVVVKGVYGEADSEYRTEIDSFSKVVASGASAVGSGSNRYHRGPISFKVWSRDGKILTYGGTDDSTVWIDKVAGDGSKRTNAGWLLSSIEDRSGNRIRVLYESMLVTRDNTKYVGEIRPVSMAYGPNGQFGVRFGYPSWAKDPRVRSYQSGLGTHYADALSLIQTMAYGKVTRSYRLTASQERDRWFVDSIKVCAPDGSSERCLPATKFTYGARRVGNPSGSLSGLSDRIGDIKGELDEEAYLTYRVIPLDADGDGNQDVIYTDPVREDGKWRERFMFRRSKGKQTNGSLFEAPVDMFPGYTKRTGKDCLPTPGGSWYCEHHLPPVLKVADINSDGLDDFYFDKQVFSLGSRGFPLLTDLKEVIKQDNVSVDFVDVDGDGQQDLVAWSSEGTWVYINESATKGTVQEQVKFKAAVKAEQACKGKFSKVQADGDGVADLVCTHEDVAHVLRRTGGGGFTWRAIGPQALPKKKQAIPLDVNGDGITDFVVASSDERLTLYLGTGAGWVRSTSKDELKWAVERFKYSFVMDSDSDGRYELWTPNGDRWTKIIPAGAHDPKSGTKWEIETTDIPFQFASGTIKYRTGVHSFDEISWEVLGYQRPVVMDANGDGAQDLLVRAKGPGADGQNTPSLGWFAGKVRQDRLINVTDGLGASNTFVYTTPSDRLYERGEFDLPNNRLPGAVHPIRGLRFLPPYIVSYFQQGGTTLDENLTARTYSRATEFRYRGAIVDLRGRGFVGYEQRVINEYLGSSPRVVRSTSHAYDPTGTRDPCKTSVGLRYKTEGVWPGIYWQQSPPPPAVDAPGIYWKAGRPVSTNVTAQSPGNDMTGGFPEYHTWATCNLWNLRKSASGRPFPVLDIKYETHWTASGPGIPYTVNASVTVSQHEFDYDDYGNLKRHYNSWSDGRRIDRNMGYSNSAAAYRDKWLIALPIGKIIETWTSDPAKPGIPDYSRQRTGYGYDEVGRLQQVLHYGAGDFPPLGIISHVPYIPVRQTITLGRDDKGNVNKVTQQAMDAVDQVVTIDYDRLGVFPKYIQNSVHIAKGMPGTRVGYTPHGQMAWQQAPDGSWTVWNYDGLGRLGETRNSLGGVETVVLRSGLTTAGPAMPLEVASSGAGYPTRIEKLDAMGRVVLSRQSDFGVLETWTMSGFDQAGRPAAVSQPYRPVNPTSNYLPRNGVRRFEYDDLGRVSVETYPWLGSNGGITTMRIVHEYASYNSIQGLPPHLVEYALPGPLRYAHRVSSAHGTGTEFTKERDLVIGRLDAANGITRISYAAVDRAHTVERAGHVTRFEYDELGQLESTTVPDSGVHVYVRDGSGRVRRYERNGETTTHSFDGLGRIERTVAPDATYETAWDGMPSVPAEIGKIKQESITSATLGNSTTEYTYGGPSASLSSIKRTIAGDTFSTSFGYDDLGEVNLVHYPSPADRPLSIRYNRNIQGRVTSVAEEGSTNPFWRLEEIDDYGGTKRARLGNGLDLTRQFDPITGIPVGTKLLRGTQVIEQDWVAFDRRGLAIARASNDGLEGFTHDVLGRIDTWTPPNASSVEYDYDAAGNLTLKPGAGALTYDPTSQPHAVRSTADGRSFEYDAAGNQIERNGPGITGGRERVHYSSFDLPHTVEVGPEENVSEVHRFAYDATGRRVRRESSLTTGPDAGKVESTTYAGDLYRVHTKKDGSQEHHAVVTTPDGASVTLRLGVGSDHEAQFHYTDRLGSTRAITDQAGKVIERRRYDPFGQEVRSTSAAIVREGYTGHEHDRELGLINMRGRIYDPSLGRFLSADPLVQEPLNSESWNRYSYVMNNPLGATDPSGFQSVTADEFSFGAVASVPGPIGPMSDGGYYSASPNIYSPNPSSSPTDAGGLQVNGGAGTETRQVEMKPGEAQDEAASDERICYADAETCRMARTAESVSGDIDTFGDAVAVIMDLLGLDGTPGVPGWLSAGVVTRRVSLQEAVKVVAKGTPRVVEHASEKAARRAALREAGIPAGAPPARNVPSNPGSQTATGPRGSRAEWDPVSDANVGVHHDPSGHLFPDGSTMQPHYGVDVPGAPTVHHTYPSGVDPRLNR